MKCLKNAAEAGIRDPFISLNAYIRRMATFSDLGLYHVKLEKKEVEERNNKEQKLLKLKSDKHYITSIKRKAGSLKTLIKLINL